MLEEVLGRGGMGTVWQAWDTLLDRPVAVKEIALPPVADEQPELRRKVLREARLAARLSHQGAVTVFDAVESDGQVFIIMELVRAETLYEMVKLTGPLPSSRVAELGLRVLDVLVEAHRLGIVHRDVKPGNIMVGDNGSVKLADFGIARLDGTDSTMTASGVLIGSPAYMAPEHIRHRAAPSSDVWALGATLFFAVEGTSPYQRETAGASIAAVLAEEPPTPVRATPALGRLLLDILAKDVKARPPVEEIRRRLAEIAMGAADVRPRLILPAARPLATLLPATGVDDEVPSPIPAKIPIQRVEVRPRRDGWLALAGVLCLLDAAWWALTVMLYRNAQLPGAFATAVVEKQEAGNGLSVFAVLWVGDAPMAYAGVHHGSTSVLARLLMLLVVTVPFLAMLPLGLALLLAGDRQIRAAALLAGSSVLWVPGAYGYGSSVLGGSSTAGSSALFGLLAMASGGVAAIIAGVRLIASDSTWLCRRTAHWALALGVVGCAALWLFTDLGSGRWTFGDTVVVIITSVAVSVIAGLMTPHQLGSRVLAGWLCVIGLRAAVDLLVLADFSDYAFTNGRLGHLARAPAELVVSATLTVSTVLIAAALSVVLFQRSHDRSEDIFDRAR